MFLLCGSLILWAVLPGASGNDSVTQEPPELIVNEGQIVSLSCSYSMSPYAYFWYIQRPGDSPKYMLKIFTSGDVSLSQDCPERISASLEKKSQRFHLNISKTREEDSAVYLCAVELTLFQGAGGSAQKLTSRISIAHCG